MENSKVKVGLESDLRRKYHVRSFPVAKGDIVRVRAGAFKGDGGKVADVDHSNSLVSVDGLTIAKSDGKQQEFWIKPHNLVITRIDLSRLDRINELKRLGNIKKIQIDKDLEEERQRQEEEERAAEEAQKKQEESLPAPEQSETPESSGGEPVNESQEDKDESEEETDDEDLEEEMDDADLKEETSGDDEDDKQD